MFIKPRNALEGERSSAQPSIPEHLYRACPSCKAAVLSQDLRANLMVCPLCGYHMRMDASRRVVIKFRMNDEDMVNEMLSILDGMNN